MVNSFNGEVSPLRDINLGLVYRSRSESSHQRADNLKHRNIPTAKRAIARIELQGRDRLGKATSSLPSGIASPCPPSS